MQRRSIAFLAVLPLAILAACQPSSQPVTGPTPLPGPAPKPSAAGHPGFDTGIYPGDDAMRTWRGASPYEWVGYYLPAPCHRDVSWAGRREALIGMGWGTAAIYVGQQDWTQMNRVPPQQPVTADSSGATQTSPPSQPQTSSPTQPQSQPQTQAQPGMQPQGAQATTAAAQCASANLVGGRGAQDADDAIARAAAEGFPAGSVVYLDVERVQTVSPALVAYAREWADRMLVEGRYLPGVYVHRANAAPLVDAMRSAWTGRGRSDALPIWVTATDPAFNLDQAPRASGFDDASIWQGRLDTTEAWGGVSLRIDQNVSGSRSPSSPR